MESWGEHHDDEKRRSRDLLPSSVEALRDMIGHGTHVGGSRKNPYSPISTTTMEEYGVEREGESDQRSSSLTT